MAQEDRIDELIDRWEELRERGENITPEELCGGDPDAVDEVRRRLKALEAFDCVFGPGAPWPPPKLGEGPNSGAARYELQKVHATGGLGVLYLARDKELRRSVIIKVVRPERAHDSLCQRQFEHEAFVTGLLEHPGVVPVYGFGSDRHGKPYYAMRLVRGETLGAAIRRYHDPQVVGDPGQRNVQFTKLLRDFLSVCQTIAFAHSRGIIHRDLKPSNIMLGRHGEVLVVDWGLAKHTGVADERSAAETTQVEPMKARDMVLSWPGLVKGSPLYMSPEQAMGRLDRVGPASDVYGLGATLYEVLTGRPPVAGSSIEDICAKVKSGDIVPPRAVNPSVPPALEAICLKAMRRDPADRYAGAPELANDVERFLADEPVSAWREPWTVHARRWVKHHRTLVTGAAAAVLVGMLALSASAVLLANKNQLLEIAHGKTKEALQEATNQKQKAVAAERAELQRADELARSLYRNQFLLAASAWQQMNAKRAETILDGCDEKLRAFEWFYLKELSRAPRVLLRGEYDSIGDVAVSRDGAFLAASGFIPGGKLGKPGAEKITLVDLRTGKQLRTFTGGAFRFSPDGKRFTAATENDQQICIIDLPTNKVLHTFPGRAAAFSPNGDMLATIAVKRKTYESVITVTVNTTTGKKVYTLRGHAPPITSLRLSPQGNRIATGSLDRTVRLWDAKTGRQLFVLIGHTATVRLVAFSPDGKTLASVGQDHTIRLWNLAAGGEQLGIIPAFDKSVYTLRFLPNGRGLAWAGSDGVVRIWDLAPRGVAPFRGEASAVGALKLVSAGRLLAGVQPDGFARAWDVETGDQKLKVPVEKEKSDILYGGDIALSADASKLAVAGAKEVRVFDVKTGRELCRLPGATGPVEFMPDGQTLVAVRREPQFVEVLEKEKLIDQVQLDARREFIRANIKKGLYRDGAHGDWLLELHLGDRNIKLVETLKQKARGALLLAEVASGRVRQTFGEPIRNRELAVHPGGRWLATAGKHEVVVWDLTTLKKVKTLAGTQHLVLFSPDGRWLVSYGGDDGASVWDTATWTLSAKVEGNILSVAFTADGRRLATGSFADKTVRLWDTATWQLLWTFDRESPLPWLTLAFSPDGRRLFAADHGGIYSAPRRQ